MHIKYWADKLIYLAAYFSNITKMLLITDVLQAKLKFSSQDSVIKRKLWHNWRDHKPKQTLDSIIQPTAP